MSELKAMSNKLSRWYSVAAVCALLQFLNSARADFSDNCPRDCNCKWANGKKEADCTRAGFTTIPTNLNNEIQILRMSHNYVRILGKEVFKSAGLLNLQRIFLNNCHAQEIHSDAFSDLKILVELDLSHNNLSHLEIGTFTGNERLQTLNLANNFISVLSPYQFPALKHLKTIDLSHNVLTELERYSFDQLGNSVETIYVNNNKLRNLREEIFIGMTNLKSLQLHTNPWLCDCNLKNFRDWVVYRGLYTYPTSCTEPERLADKLWQDIDPKDFACKPEIRVPQSIVFSQPGANVTLSCFIIGTPKPDAKWVLKGRIVNNNTFPVGSPKTISTFSQAEATLPTVKEQNEEQSEESHQTQYLIHEKGGLQRWFNLTIISIGADAASDYTCVAVNAGGVMEESITLTFEEPKPVGLPGGKREESNIAIIIGAVAGSSLFFLTLIFIYCCCCKKRKDSHRNHHSVNTHSSSDTSKNTKLSTDTRPVRLPHYSADDNGDTAKRPMPSQTVVVAENKSGELASYFHSIADPEKFPDLVNVTDSCYSSFSGQGGASGVGTPMTFISNSEFLQPLNPASLVVPISPPEQFPHQFEHLIRKKPSTKAKPALLSPPPEFSEVHSGEIRSGPITFEQKPTCSAKTSLLVHRNASPSGYAQDPFPNTHIICSHGAAREQTWSKPVSPKVELPLQKPQRVIKGILKKDSCIKEPNSKQYYQTTSDLENVEMTSLLN